MNDSFLTYGKQSIDDNDINAVIEVLKSDWLTQGPRIQELEEILCRITNAKYAVVVSNGTAALHLAAIAAGFSKNDEVITTPITFLASANCILYCGATPVFSDIEKQTFNLDSRLLEKSITKNTKALIPVHLGGVPCNMEEVKNIADTHNLIVIEDACHALGSIYKNSKIGSCVYSDMSVFSFHPVKTIATGEGGAITTNNKKLYEKLLLLRNHGLTRDPKKLSKNIGPWYYEMQSLGFNYRITDIQCALGISQLKKLDKFIEKRREIMKLYRKAFASVSWLKLQYEPEDCFSAYHLCIINIDYNFIKRDRTETMQFLREKGIGTQVHYIPIYKQPYYQQLLKIKPVCPNSEQYYQYALSLPLYPTLKKEDVQRVINAVLELAK